jgi:alpha-L-arabinofuranosidase
VTHLYGNLPACHLVPVDLSCAAFDNPTTQVVPRENVPRLDPLCLLSDDGDVLFIVVISRHPREAIPAAISLAGFTPGPRAQVRTITGSSFLAGNTWNETHVTPKTATIDVGAGNCVYTFPACSLTAIRMTRDGD